MKKGLTLVELVIALAIIAIIGAILVPNFLSTTDKARLKSDIQSARVIQNALELYKAEHGTDAVGSNMNQILRTLTQDGYIKERSVTIQTVGAKWEIDSKKGVVVNITDAKDKANVNKAFSQLSNAEKDCVTGYSGTPDENIG